ncbi:MAG: ribbon-helix-helix domain-containing protein [Calditrichales bacterium]|nr:ribbon-helix-helix domain-containing protein [Calditrichales bacterium]
MKIKTSLTLSEDLISIIDKKAIEHKSRSDFIEHALWVYLKHLIRQEKNMLDLVKINENSDFLNNEAQDILDYQVTL